MDRGAQTVPPGPGLPPSLCRSSLCRFRLGQVLRLEGQAVRAASRSDPHSLAVPGQSECRFCWVLAEGPSSGLPWTCLGHQTFVNHSRGRQEGVFSLLDLGWCPPEPGGLEEEGRWFCEGERRRDGCSGQNQQMSTARPWYWEVRARTSLLTGDNLYPTSCIEGLQYTKQTYSAHRLAMSCRRPSQSWRTWASCPAPRKQAGVHHSLGREKTLPPWFCHYKKGLTMTGRSCLVLGSPMGGSPPTGFL